MKTKDIVRVDKQEIKRVLLHLPLGLLACLLAYAHWSLSLVFTASFLYYELNEDMHLSDEAFKDVKGFAWGIGIGGIIIFVMKLGGML